MTKDNNPSEVQESKYTSWRNKEENKEMFNFPISVLHDGEWWVASCNDETKKLLGDRLYGIAQGRTKEEAINGMFLSIRVMYDYSEKCRLNYQRFVPFRKGDWSHKGGKWVVIFGMQIYFRHGSNLKGGTYIPFTKWNISFRNKWKIYKEFKQNIYGKKDK